MPEDWINCRAAEADLKRIYYSIYSLCGLLLVHVWKFLLELLTLHPTVLHISSKRKYISELARPKKAGSRVHGCVALCASDGIRLLIVIPDVPFSGQFVADNNKITRRDLALDVCALS